MKLQKESRTTLLRLACGTLVGAALMLLVFALLGKLSRSVVIGALVGVCATVLHFYLLCICVQKAVTKGDRAKAYMQSTLALRNMLLLGIMIAGITLLETQPVATILPALFPRITIFVLQLTGAYRPEATTEGEEEA